MDYTIENKDYTELSQRVLAWVNDVRSNYNLPPVPALLPGLVENSTECPLANTFRANGGDQAFKDVEIDYTGIQLAPEGLGEDESPDLYSNSWTADNPMPDYIEEFIRVIDEVDIEDPFIESLRLH